MFVSCVGNKDKVDERDNKFTIAVQGQARIRKET